MTPTSHDCERDISVFDVFTPAATPAKRVSRPVIAAAIARALAVPGRQLLLFGETGCGKSTALYSQLRGNYLVARCTPESTVSSLVNAALVHFELEPNPDLSIGIPRAAHALGSRQLRVVVEDAHRLAPIERERLMSAMKVFSDMATQYPTLMVIAVAAIDSAAQFSGFDLEFSSRIAEVHVPSMSVEELATLVRDGGELLNVDANGIAAEIAVRSGGLPAIAHSLALSCFLKAGITECTSERRSLGRNDLGGAILERLARTPSHISSRFEAAVNSPRHRGLVTEIFTAMSLSDPDGIRIADLTRSVRGESIRPASDHIPDVLEQLENTTGLIKIMPRDRVRFASGQLHSYWRLVSQQPV